MISCFRLRDELGADRVECVVQGDLLTVRAWWDARCERIIQIFSEAQIRQAVLPYEFVCNKMKELRER